MAVLAVDEASALHPDRWILFEVTQLDSNQRPTRGSVRLASEDRAAITEESLRLRDSGSVGPLFIFHSSPGDALLDPGLELFDDMTPKSR